MTDKKRAKRLLRELHKRQKIKAINLFAEAFQQQRAFLEDRSKLKAALCSRRAGKSYAVALLLLQAALQKPRQTLLFITLTLGTAKKILERDIFHPVLKRHKIPEDYHHTEHYLELPNGSRIYMLGGDSKPDEWKKFLGQQYAGCVIDEAGSFKQDLRKIIDSIKPALVDQDGWIAMIGTPELNTHFKGQPTIFYAATSNLEPGWSCHRWNALDNPHIKWQHAIDKEEELNPNFKLTTTYKRYYLGDWVIDDTARVYRFDALNNSIPKAPDLKDLIYTLGIDFGYTDETAFVLCAYSPYQKRLYVLTANKYKGMIDEDIIAHITNLRSLYPISHFICDPASKQLIESIRYRSLIPFEAAQKQDKQRFIELLNSDLLSLHIQLVSSSTQPLIKELLELTWSETPNGKRQENPGQPNHCTDAFLYAWRFSKFFHGKPDPIFVPKTAIDIISAYWQAKDEQLDTDRNQDNYLNRQLGFDWSDFGSTEHK